MGSRPSRSPSEATAPKSGLPSARIAVPLISEGTGRPSRSRIVGARSVELT